MRKYDKFEKKCVENKTDNGHSEDLSKSNAASNINKSNFFTDKKQQ